MKPSWSVPQVDADLGRVHGDVQLVPVGDAGDGERDDFQERGGLEVAQFGLRVRIVHPAVVLDSFVGHFAAREREMLRGVQVGPGHLAEGVFRLEHLEGVRADVYVEGAVEVTVQVQAARFEERPLPFQRAVGIVPGRAGSHAVAAHQYAAQDGPGGRRGGRSFLVPVHVRRYYTRPARAGIVISAPVCYNECNRFVGGFRVVWEVRMRSRRSVYARMSSRNRSSSWEDNLCLTKR